MSIEFHRVMSLRNNYINNDYIINTNKGNSKTILFVHINLTCVVIY